MPFTTDRDLLILEPGLFRQVQWVAQRLISATCSVSGTTLTSSGVDFVAQNVGPGHVALADGVAVEVVARLSATSLTVSRPRATLDEATVPPAQVTNKTLTISTFLPQVQIVHEQLLRMLGIEPADAGVSGLAGVDGVLTEAAIMNPRSLRLVEALGALHLIYAGASTVGDTGVEGGAAARAELYRARFEQVRRIAAARIDTDGDGIADATRHLNVMQLTRC
jgi:hypothetical protein